MLRFERVRVSARRDVSGGERVYRAAIIYMNDKGTHGIVCFLVCTPGGGGWADFVDLLEKPPYEKGREGVYVGVCLAQELQFCNEVSFRFNARGRRVRRSA